MRRPQSVERATGSAPRLLYNLIVAEGVMLLTNNDNAMALPPDMEELKKVMIELGDDTRRDYGMKNRAPLVPDGSNYVAHEGTLTLGDIYDRCRNFPPEGKFVMLFFVKEINKFLQSDESICNITTEWDSKRLCMYSGYHDECKNSQNKDFLNACDPDKIGKVCRTITKNGHTWEINDDTPIYANTKLYGNHTINDVILFEYNGCPYIGFVSNTTVV